MRARRFFSDLTVLISTLALIPGCAELLPPAPPPAASGELEAPDMETAVEPAPALPVPECELDEYGLRRRVIVLREGLCCVQEPGGREVGQPLKYFRPYFVFATQHRDGRPQFYQIGAEPYRRCIDGWVSADAVAAWPALVGARLVGPTLLVYEDPESLVTLLRGGTPAAKPLARATWQAERTYMPWPISEVRRVEINGRSHELVRVRFLGEDPAAATPAGTWNAPDAYSDQVVQGIEQQIGKLDIVFCVDNSESTKVYANVIREAIRSISQQLKASDVHFGLTLYRDYASHVKFPEGVVRCAFPLGGNLDDFLATVNAVEEANGDPHDWSEAGYDGLLASIANTHWRGDKLAHRVVVMVSDNSFHEPDSDRNPRGIGLQEITSAATERHVKVFGLCIRGAGGNGEQARHHQQQEAIARATGGSVRTLAAASLASDARGLAEHVQIVLGLLESQRQPVVARPGVVQDLREGLTTEQISQRRRLPIHEVTDVLELLEGAGYDLRKMIASGPVPVEGWALCEFQGVSLLEREVYISEGELDALLATLNLLSSYCSSDFGEVVLETAILSRTNPFADFMSNGFPGTLDLYLMARGIPAGQTSILRKTAEDIRRMTKIERTALRQRLVNEYIKGLQAARGNATTWQPAANQQYGWLPERLFLSGVGVHALACRRSQTAPGQDTLKRELQRGHAKA